MGKGDGRRPAAIDPATEAANWERTFGKPRKVPAPAPGGSQEAAKGNSHADCRLCEGTGISTSYGTVCIGPY